MAKKSKISDPDFQDRFIKYIKGGNDIKVACALCGVAEATFQSWQTKGREGKEPYKKFIAKYDRAKYVAESRMLKVITDCAFDGDPKSAQWFLERKGEGRWTKQTNVNVGQEKDFKIQIVEGKPKESEEDEGDNLEIKPEADIPHKE